MRNRNSEAYKRIAQGFLGFFIVFLVLVFAWWASKYVADNIEVQEVIAEFGYLGVFIVSVISGFNVFIPVPAVSFLPILVESGLNFWISIIVITLGMTLGDSLGYLLGYVGRAVTDVEKTYIFRKLHKIKVKRKWLPILILVIYSGFAPLPNEAMVIPMAVLGYEYKYILPAILLGNLIFNTLAAFGIISLFNIL